jgi:hypothetical protein
VFVNESIQNGARFAPLNARHPTVGILGVNLRRIYTGLSRVLMGSVAEAVIRRAPCAVVAIREEVRTPSERVQYAAPTHGRRRRSPSKQKAGSLRSARVPASDTLVACIDDVRHFKTKDSAMPSSFASSRKCHTSTLVDPQSPVDTKSRPADRIDDDVRRIVERHPNFRGRTATIHAERHSDKLVLTGRLPSFYLKQLLQEAVRSIDGISRVDNRIDVVSCNNLSSEKPAGSVQH